MAEATAKPVRQVSGFSKFAFGLQVFLLRRGWMGSMGDFVMVITTTGRKTGRKFTIPIAYKLDGEEVIAINRGNSNWFRNVVANGQAIIEIKGKVMPVQGEVVKDETERQRIFDVYKTDPAVMDRLFHVTPDSPEDEQQAALAKWQFVKFRKLNS